MMSSETGQRNVYDDCSAIPAVKLAYVRRFWATHGQPRALTAMTGHKISSPSSFAFARNSSPWPVPGARRACVCRHDSGRRRSVHTRSCAFWMWVSLLKAQTPCALCGRASRRHSGVTHRRWSLLTQRF